MATVLNKPTRLYKDIDLSFAQNPNTLDFSKKIDVQAVKQSMKILMNTMYYEKPFDPNFGSSIRSMLFENFGDDTAKRLADAIKEAFENYEPRVKIEQIECIPNIDSNEYDINIHFYVLGINRLQVYEASLEALR